MDRIFFSSTYFSESGPSEVNRNLVENFPKGSVSCLRFRNKYLIRLETIFKILWCRVLIISALGQKDYEVKLAKVLGKKIIYIMHGFAEDDSAYLKARQDYLFPRVDFILCVSELFKNLVQQKYPKMSNKLGVLYNGIPWEKIASSIKDIHVVRNPKEIALIGGGRFIKKNLNVCRAVQEINQEQGLNLHVSVYGPYCEDDESKSISDIDCVSFVGLVPHHILLERLCATGLLVQASLSESFGLGVVEALVCGCSIVVSKNVGALGVIPAIMPEEVISNPSDIEEIKKHIIWGIDHPNNKRLLDSIDKDSTSLSNASSILVSISKQFIYSCLYFISLHMLHLC